MQIDLGTSVRVVGLVSQGRGGQRVTEYKIAYSETGQDQDFTEMPEAFPANMDSSNAKVKNLFRKSVFARYIRVIVQKWSSHASMRAGALVEVCGENADLDADACFESGNHFEPKDMKEQGRSIETSAAMCQERCSSVDGCEHFSWWADGGCHLQDESAVRQGSRCTTVAGPRSCGRGKR